MQQIPVTEIMYNDVQIDLLRLDLAQPGIQGNKWFKLKYNLEEASQHNFETLLSFGGAFSNFIHALSVAGKQFKFKTVGVIRGEDDPENPTLKFAREQGMVLEFISRESYKRKTEMELISELKNKFGNFYLIPEGGTNSLAIKGCSEILSGFENTYDQIFCAVGTGGTLAGLISTPGLTASVTGVLVLKGAEQIAASIQVLLADETVKWNLNHDYHFGGYAKHDQQLIDFIRRIWDTYKIPLDPVYTAKMLFAVFDLVSTGRLMPGSKIMAVHTGGLQGVTGWEYRFGKIIN